MKFLVIILLGIALHGNTSDSYAWDSTAAKYMPLQVGNTWVYIGTASGYIYYGRYYYSVKINGIIDTLGKKYFTLQHRFVQISGSYTCGILHFSEAIRIDSSSMNLYKLGNYCNNNEMLLDSLKAKVNDSTKLCTSYYTSSVCVDTVDYSIFNNNYKSKRFIEFLGPVYSTTYAKGIGIVSYGYGYSMNQCQDSLKGCVINGVLYGDTSTLVGINQISTEIPDKFELHQNYPNPFNPVTKIKFTISGTTVAQTILFVYDLLGHEVAVLVNQLLKPGTYESDFDGSNLPSGVYYYKLQSGSFTETKKMVLIK